MSVNYDDYPFIIKEYTIPAAPIREYPHSVLEDGCLLSLNVKQYIPKDNQNPSIGDITFIVSPGTALVKELYEPLYEEIHVRSRKDGFKIRSIWAADPTYIGQSALVNESKLGNEVNWFDHSRDLLQMVNHFRDEIKRPLMGIGHSAGGCSLAFLAILHPRLLTSIALVEPAISTGLPAHIALPHMRSIVRRKEVFSNKDEAIAHTGKSSFYADWDPRTILRLQKYGFKPADSSNTDREAVRTSITVAMEAANYFRGNLCGVGSGGLDSMTAEERQDVPDVDPDAYWTAPLYKPEPVIMWQLLPSIRPRVMYLIGDESIHSVPSMVRTRTEKTGTGVGGSGGHKIGAVVTKTVQGGKHLMVIDKSVGKVGEEISKWVKHELDFWTQIELKRKREWESESLKDRQKLQKALHQAVISYPEDKKRGQIVVNPRKGLEKL